MREEASVADDDEKEGKARGSSQLSPTAAAAAAAAAPANREKETDTKEERERALRNREQMFQEEVTLRLTTLNLRSQEHQRRLAEWGEEKKRMRVREASIASAQRRLQEKEADIVAQEEEATGLRKKVARERAVVESLRGRVRIQDAELIVRLSQAKKEAETLKRQREESTRTKETLDRERSAMDERASALERRRAELEREVRERKREVEEANEKNVCTMEEKEKELQAWKKRLLVQETSLAHQQETIDRREKRLLAFAADVEMQTSEIKARGKYEFELS